MDQLNAFLTNVSSFQTRRAYRTDLQRFFGQKEVDDAVVQTIGVEAIQSFVRAMHRKNRSLSTQRRRLAALRSFYDWLIQEGIVSSNPARHPTVKPLRPEEEPTNASTLSTNEVQTLLAAAGEFSTTGERDQALLLTIVYGALRRSEVARLKVEDVRPLGRYWILDLQTKENSGYVRIPEPVVEAIEQMREEYDIASGPLWRSVSNRNRGQPMSPDAIYKVVRRVSERAGLGVVSIDMLRRTGLQLALEGGADVPQVQAHGRFRNSASAARLHDSEKQSGTLGESAVEYIDLDVSAHLSISDD